MRPGFGRAILGGLLGTVALTLMMKFVAPLMGVHMDIAQNLANMMHAPKAAGMLAHFMNGTLIFPAIYTFLLYRLLPGGPVVKGLIWGGILWFLLEIPVMPMLGMGVFGSAGPGVKGAAAAILAHLVYGAILGAVAGEAEAPQRVVTA
jgi:hypothetical protein